MAPVAGSGRPRRGACRPPYHPPRLGYAAWRRLAGTTTPRGPVGNVADDCGCRGGVPVPAGRVVASTEPACNPVPDVVVLLPVRDAHRRVHPRQSGPHHGKPHGHTGVRDGRGVRLGTLSSQARGADLHVASDEPVCPNSGRSRRHVRCGRVLSGVRYRADCGLFRRGVCHCRVRARDTADAVSRRVSRKPRARPPVFGAPLPGVDGLGSDPLCDAVVVQHRHSGARHRHSGRRRRGTRAPVASGRTPRHAAGVLCDARVRGRTGALGGVHPARRRPVSAVPLGRDGAGVRSGARRRCGDHRFWPAFAPIVRPPSGVTRSDGSARRPRRTESRCRPDERRRPAG